MAIATTLDMEKEEILRERITFILDEYERLGTMEVPKFEGCPDAYHALVGAIDARMSTLGVLFDCTFTQYTELECLHKLELEFIPKHSGLVSIESKYIPLDSIGPCIKHKYREKLSRVEVLSTSVNSRDKYLSKYDNLHTQLSIDHMNNVLERDREELNSAIFDITLGTSFNLRDIPTILEACSSWYIGVHTLIGEIPIRTGRSSYCKSIGSYELFYLPAEMLAKHNLVSRLYTGSHTLYYK